MLTTPAKPPSGVTSGGIQCFKLSYEALEGYGNLLGRKLEQRATQATYRLRGCLYNSSTREFIGRFYDTPECSLVEILQSGAVVCPIQQNAFFYSIQSDPNYMLITEITGYYDELSEVCVGWSMYPLFHQQSQTGQIKSVSEARRMLATPIRLAVYEGTPRALFSLKHPTQDGSYLTTVPGCILSLSIVPYPAITRASHMVPPLVLISLSDIVPGLIQMDSIEAFPKLMKSTPLTIDKMSLLLLPTVDDFEGNLLSSLAEDLVYQGSGVDDTSPIVIEERRLKVMVYNGWRYVGSPCIGYLDKVSSSSKSKGLSSAMIMQSSRSSLVLKGSLDLSNVVRHELLEVVFQLEYAVSWKTMHSLISSTSHSPARRAPKPASVQNSTVALCWAVWQPYANLVEDEQAASYTTARQTTLELKSGHGFKPMILPYSAHAACYKDHIGDAGKLAFRCILSKLSGRREGSHLLNTSSGSNLLDSYGQLPEQPVDSGNMVPLPMTGDELKQPTESPGHKVPITSTPLRCPVKGTTASSPLLSPHPTPAMHIKQVTGVMAPGTFNKARKEIPRNTLAYFYSSGLTDFKDDTGNSLPIIEQASGVLGKAASNDKISEPHEIALQLLGFEQVDQSGNSLPLATRSLTQLIIEVQFYNFPLVVMHVVARAPPSHSKHLPHLLLASTSDQFQPMSHHFPIGPECLASRVEQHKYCATMRHGHLSLTVYDGSSLILLGMAHVPLAGLIPLDSSSSGAGSLYVQHSICCPVYLHNSAICSDVLDSMSSFSSLESSASGHVMGHLYLRLARLPPKAGCVIHSAQYPDIAKLKPVKTISSVARRLYGNAPWKSERDFAGDLPKKEDDITRSRKHSRMQRVREAQRKTAISHMSLQKNRESDVSSSNAIEVQQDELKYERISSVLQEALATHYVLRPMAGQVLYLEHTFTNNLNHPLSVSISWKHPDLRLVTDKKECQFLRRLHSANDAYHHAQIVTENEREAAFGFLVHHGETVLLPFKFQTYNTKNNSESGMSDKGSSGTDETIKVYLLASRHDIVGILDLLIKPRPQKVDRVLHFVHPERTFLKKSIEADVSHPLFISNTPDNEGFGVLGIEDLEQGSLYACTSDPEIMCEVQKVKEQNSVFVKVLVGAAPLVQQFYVFLYSKLYQTSPSEVWQVIIHSAFRIRQPLTLGQASAVKLLVRGDHMHRKVSCYSCSAPTMAVVSGSSFLLNAHSLHEVQLSLRTLSLQVQTFLVSVVEVGGAPSQGTTRYLIGLWLIEVAVQEPVITKAFQITLPTGSTVIEKNITFINPYPKVKEYRFSTDHPNIITFKQTTNTLEPQETVLLSLLFHPSSSNSTKDIFVFINDPADQIEECFLIKVNYSEI